MRPANQPKITDVTPCHTKRLEAPALKELDRPMQFSYLCMVHTVHLTRLVRAVQRLMITLSVNDNFEELSVNENIERNESGRTIPTYAWRVLTQESVTSDCYEGIHHLPDVVVQDQRGRAHKLFHLFVFELTMS